jgi:hypothetical protein
MYYARGSEDRQLDDELREIVKNSGDEGLMAIYIQNQEILSLLRRHDIEFSKLNFELRKVRQMD